MNSDFFQQRNTRRFLAAAGLVLLIFTLLALITPGGSDEGSDSSAGGYSEAAPSFSKDSGSVSRFSPEFESKPTANEYEPNDTPTETELETPREVVVTGSATVRVKRPAQEAEALSSWVLEQDGYVSDLQTDRYESGDEVVETATITVRLADVDKAVAYLKTLRDSEVLNKNVTRRDVTLQAADLDARIEALELSIARLQDFVAQAKTYDDLFRAETELTNRQAQLDSLNAQRKVLTDQVSLQTLTVTFTASEKAATVTDEAGRSFSDGLLNGWNSLVSFTTDVLYGLASFLPWLIILTPVALVTYVLIRLRSRRRSAGVKETQS